VQKRGQITIFIIVGLVVLLSTALVIFLTETEQGRKLNEQLGIGIGAPFDLSELDDYITTCLDMVSYPLIKNLSSNGGTFDPDISRDYAQKHHNYLCLRLAGFDGCVNSLLTRQDMEQELESEIKAGLETCIDLTNFEVKGFSIVEDDMEVDVSVRVDDIRVMLDYPLKLTRSNKTSTIDEFSTTVLLPLGRLYDLANYILNKEISYEGFEQEKWMFDHDNSILIEKSRPYPDIVYSLHGDGLEFNFAIEGEHTQGEGTRLDHSFGCCFNSYDNNCFENAPSGSCIAEGMSYQNSCICQGFSYFEIFDEGTCMGEECDDCDRTYSPLTKDFTGPAKLHGESWCVYDNLFGDGKDSVGSRHFKHYCIDGDEYVEGCRDFREEICEESIEIINGQEYSDASCRLNRWGACSRCTTEECCTEPDKDCIWGSLDLNETCLPAIPPGTRFWEFDGMDICSDANQMTECSGMSCDQSWVDSSAVYCYSMGDCGNYVNYRDDFTSEGYLNTNKRESDIYDIPRRTSPLSAILADYTYVEREDSVVTDIIGMLTATIEYLDEISSYSIEDYLSTVVDIDMTAMTYCLPWSAPTGASDCEACNDNLLRPCSEYRCKSISQGCGFEEIDGVGYCFDFLDNDLTSPTIDIDDRVLPDGYTVSETNFMNFIGYEVNEPIKPHQSFEVGIVTSEPTQCKMTYIPGRDYNKLKPFGFDSFEFDSEHNLSLRFPDDDELNEKLLNLFDVADLDNIIELIDEFEEKLETDDSYEPYRDQFEAVISPFKDIISTHEQRARFQNLMGRLEQGEYYLFVKCVDRAGNSNEDDFFITFSIADPEQKAPTILHSSPSNTSISIAQSTVLYSVLTDTMGECRYDLTDMGYDSMMYSYRCPVSEYDLHPFLGGTYRCEADIRLPSYVVTGDNLTIYSRCMEYPSDQDKFTLTIANGSEDIHEDMELLGSLLKIPSDIGRKEHKISLDFTPTVEILSFKACRYSPNQTSFERMLPCGDNCTFTAKESSYHIACSDGGSSYLMNSESHISVFPLRAPLRIDVVGPSDVIEGKTGKINLSVKMSANISETGAICGYSESSDQGVLPMYKFDDHTYISTVVVDDGDHEYFFRCWDEVGIVEANTTFSYLELW